MTDVSMLTGLFFGSFIVSVIIHLILRNHSDIASVILAAFFIPTAISFTFIVIFGTQIDNVMELETLITLVSNELIIFAPAYAGGMCGTILIVPRKRRRS